MHLAVLVWATHGHRLHLHHHMLTSAWAAHYHMPLLAAVQWHVHLTWKKVMIKSIIL